MALAENDLAQFTGTEHHYRYSPLFRTKLTDGAKYVADEAGAYWLMDIISSMQLDTRIRNEEFQVWELTVTGVSGVVACGDGNGNEIYTQSIEYTDFPLSHIKFYFDDDVIMLPSEY